MDGATDLCHSRIDAVVEIWTIDLFGRSFEADIRSHSDAFGRVDSRFELLWLYQIPELLLGDVTRRFIPPGAVSEITFHELWACSVDSNKSCIRIE